MKHLLMLLVALAIFTYSSEAQHIDDFHVKHYNTENGLPQNSIKAIAPDEYGFLWIASEAGLLRYDGGSFNIYNKKNTEIRTNRIISIAKVLRTKELLAIPDHGKMLLIEKGKVRAYPHTLNATFFQSSQYNNRSTDSILNVVFRKYKYMDRRLFFPEDNLVALLFLRGGIHWYEKGTLIAHTALPPLKDFTSVFVADKALFLSSKSLSTGVITRVQPGNVHQVRITGDFMKGGTSSAPEEAFFLSNEATGEVFLSSGSHLYTVNLLADGNLHTTLLLFGFNLSAHQINVIHYDSTQRRLFLGSGTEGLLVLTRKRFFTSLLPDKDIFANVYYSLVPLSENTLLSGTGVVLSTQKGFEPELRKLFRRPGNYGYELFRSSRGIWFSYDQHLYQLDSTGNKTIQVFDVPTASAIAEHNNDIWVASMLTGIYKIDTTDHVFQIQKTIRNAQCMVWETDSVCWIGTEEYLFRYHSRSGKIDTIPALNGKIVRSIHIPKPNEIWICSYENGLYLLKDDKLTSFSTIEYPALFTVHKILEDRSGFLWLSTNNGLYQVARTDLLHHSEDTSFLPYFYRYGSEDGFLTNEFNGSRQHAGTRLANSFFAFPSMKGVVFFNPEITAPELPDKPIIIDKIMVDGQEKKFLQHGITIERDFEQLNITPGTAYFGNAANLKYEFKLNSSTKWKTLTNGSIILSALPSGKNHVTIRKRSGFGANGFVYCYLDIYVPPAWWEHTRFYIVLLVLLSVLFWLAVWMRTRYWRRRSQRFEEAVHTRTMELNEMILELERSELKLGEQLHFQRLLNENITHDVNAPLKYLNIYTKEVMEQVKVKRMPDIHDMEHIHNATNNIRSLIENLTLFLKTKYEVPALSTVRVWELVNQKLDLFSIGAKKRHVLLDNHTDPAIVVNQSETLLGIVIHNLIDNALKNTSKGDVLVTTIQEEKMLLLRIRDTGRGMAADQVRRYNSFFKEQIYRKTTVPSGFGYIIVKEIAKILHVTIHIESVVNEGTTVTIGIPQNSSVEE